MITIEKDLLSFRLRETAQGDEIFDIFRKKWVLITPEEWVRQCLLTFLVQQKKYPAALFAVERGLKVGDLQRRFDAVVFNRMGKPYLLVECKAPGERIEDAAISQILSYQSVLGATFLLLTNGTVSRCWQINGHSVKEIHELPPAP